MSERLGIEGAGDGIRSEGRRFVKEGAGEGDRGVEGEGWVQGAERAVETRGAADDERVPRISAAV